MRVGIPMSRIENLQLVSASQNNFPFTGGSFHNEQYESGREVASTTQERVACLLLTF